MDLSGFYEFSKTKPTGVSPAELSAFEEQHDLKLPDDYKEFYLNFDGFEFERAYGHIHRLEEIFELEPALKLIAFTSAESNCYGLCCAGELRGMVMYYPHDGFARLSGMSFSDFLEDVLVKYQEFLLEPLQRNSNHSHGEKSIGPDGTDRPSVEFMEEMLGIKLYGQETDDNSIWSSIFKPRLMDNVFDMNERIDPWWKYTQSQKSQYAVKVINASFKEFPLDDDCTLPRIVEGALRLLTEDDLPQVRHLLKHENYYVRNDMLSYVRRLPEPYCSDAYLEYLDEMNRFARRVLAIYQKHGISAELQETSGAMPVLKTALADRGVHLEMLYCYKDDPEIENVLTRHYKQD